MKKRGVLLALAVVAVAGIALWYTKWRDRPATRATPAVTRGATTAETSPPTTAMTAPQLRARVIVTVTERGKGPIAGASVRVIGEDGAPAVAITDANGVAKLEDLEPGDYRISASATGFVPAASPARTLAAGADEALALALEPGGRPLTGTVSDASGGPVTDARVSAVRMGANGRAGEAVATTVTAADGTYALTVTEGHTIVSVTSPDYAPQARSIEIGPAGAKADFALVPGGVIEGVVRDARTSEPVPGALVEAERDGGMKFGEAGRRRAKAGTDGRFRIGGLRPGAYEVTATAETRRTREPTIVGLGVAEQVTDVELLVGAAPTVSGTVVDEANAPVPGVEVLAMGRGRDGASAKTDAKGAFVLSGLSPGSFTLMARDDKHTPVFGPPIDLADKDVTGAVVRVRRGLEIVGRVDPPQACSVEHQRADDTPSGPMMIFPIAPAATNADGRFSLGPATPGKARLSAMCDSGDRGELVVDVAPGMAEVVLAVKAGASISGKVVDGAGKPVSGMNVMATPDTGVIETRIVNGVVTSGVQALTNAGGAYRIVGLPEGTHRVSVLDRGRPARMRGKPPVVKLGATEHKTGVDLAVELPDGVIEGVVTGPDGKPLADAWVSVHQDLSAMFRGPEDDDADPGEHRSVTRIETRESDDEQGGDSDVAPVLTDAQGRFAVRGLPRAKYEVIAEAQAGALRGRAAGVEPDAKVTIRALGVTSLSGTVRGANGPVALFTVELDGPTSATRTFTGGTFSLGRVDPGDYTVRVRSADGNGEAKVTVIANRAATVDLVLAANATVVGKLVDPQGKPLPEVGVIVVPDAGDGRTRISVEGMPPSSGADGSFRVTAKAGASALVVLAQPRPVIKKGLALQAGQTFDAGTITVDPNARPPR